MTGWTVIGAGVLGASIGSFLNVCVDRWPGGRSVLSPPSRCDSCGAPVRWFQNIPLVSYLALRGQCAACNIRLTLQYPLVEVAVALIWAGMAAQWGAAAETVRGGLLLTILLGIALTDARTYVIPDQFTLGGAALGLLLAPLPDGPTLAEAAIGAAIGFGFLWIVAVVGKFFLGKDAMGGGDVKMMAMAGAFLGPAGAVITLFAGALVGSVIFGPVSLRTGRLVPFGIFLALGAGIAYGWGDALAGWYLDTVLALK